MRSRSGRLLAVSLMSGLLAMASADSVLAQGKPPSGGSQPDKGQPSGAPGGDKGQADKGQGATKPKKPMSEAQKKKEAKKLYDDAKDKFDKGDYAAAYDLYKQADELVPGASPKYNAALSLDKQGKVQEAIAAYQAFLDSNPEPDKHKDKIDDAKARIEALKKTPAKVKVATTPASPPNLKLAVDGAVQPGPELAVPPGHHTISATADGFEPASQDIDVGFAETKDVALQLKEAAPAAAAPPPPPPTETAPTPPPKPPKEPRSPVPAYVTLGLAGVGAIVGTIFGIKALGSKSDFDKNPTTDNADAADRNALIADMSFAVALTFGVTGVVLLVSNDSDEAKTAHAKPKQSPLRPVRGFVTPYGGPHGGGAAATLQF